MKKFQTVIFALCRQQCLKEVRTYALQPARIGSRGGFEWIWILVKRYWRKWTRGYVPTTRTAGYQKKPRPDLLKTVTPCSFLHVSHCCLQPGWLRSSCGQLGEGTFSTFRCDVREPIIKTLFHHNTEYKRSYLPFFLQISMVAGITLNNKKKLSIFLFSVWRGLAPGIPTMYAMYWCFCRILLFIGTGNQLQKIRTSRQWYLSSDLTPFFSGLTLSVDNINLSLNCPRCEIETSGEELTHYFKKMERL